MWISLYVQLVLGTHDQQTCVKSIERSVERQFYPSCIRVLVVVVVVVLRIISDSRAEIVK